MRVEVIYYIVAIIAYISSSGIAFPNDISKQPQNDSVTVHEITHRSHHQKFGTEEQIQQSENIRHIIANQQIETIPPLIRIEQRNGEDIQKNVKKQKSLITIDDEKFPTLEELRAKCQHFSRLFGLNPSESGIIETHSDKRSRSTTLPTKTEHNNRPIIEVTRRPVFIRNKQTFIERGSGGFYVTSSSTRNDLSTTRNPLWTSSSNNYPRVTEPSASTQRTTTTTTPRSETTTEGRSSTIRPKIKIKYTKFEPVILQKTILTDGRVMYHWHRSLPTAAIDLPAPVAPIPTPIIPPVSYEYTNVADMMKSSQRNLDPITASITEPQTSSTTTTEKSTWLFVPFSSLFGGSSSEEETTTMDSSSSSSPSSTKSDTTTDENNLKKHSSEPSLPQHTSENSKHAQLKLVVPVHYDDVDATISDHNSRLAEPSSPTLQLIDTVGGPQAIQSYSTLGYTGPRYGYTLNNGIPYAAPYGPGYMNYQPYNNVHLERQNRRLDEVNFR